MKSLLVLPVLALALGGSVAQAKPYAGHELAGQAQVQRAKAQAIALQARPGRITDTELEKEAGGLRWSFDIKSHGKTYEVGVDARTGTVLENKAEGKNPD